MFDPTAACSALRLDGTLRRQHVFAATLVDLLTGPRQLELFGCAHGSLTPQAYAWMSCGLREDSRGVVLQLGGLGTISFFNPADLSVSGAYHGYGPYRSHETVMQGVNGVPQDLWSLAVIALEMATGVAATLVMETKCVSHCCLRGYPGQYACI